MAQHLDIASGAAGPAATWLATEWLLTNGRGSYASSTVVGLPTRKYHGLLVSAGRSAGERAVLLAALAEELVLPDQAFPLACFEFDGVFHPRGDQFLVGFDSDPSAGLVRFTYRFGPLSLAKSLVLARGADALTVRYELSGPADLAGRAQLRVTPFVAYRHYHANRHAAARPAVNVEAVEGALRLTDPAAQLPAMRLQLSDPPGGRMAEFHSATQWWYRFFYRAEAERGEGAWEDLFTPGRLQWAFAAEQSGVRSCELRAAAEPFEPVSFSDALASQQAHRQGLLRAAESAAGGPAGPRWAELVLAADDFVAHPPASPRIWDESARGIWTILAGFHWFGEWGRDAFVALPGLLLETGRSELAHGVLMRFARSIRNGLVANRFSDEPGRTTPIAGEPCDYNSVDASLWFVRAAFAWAERTGQWDRFDADLLGPVRAILDAYHAGTDYNIRVDDDGLLACGWPAVQLTWMDAMVDPGQPFTPRDGKPVEVNALYGHALRRLIGRLEARSDSAAASYRQRHDRWRGRFAAAFASPRGGLYDRIDSAGRPDDSIRPNQLLAVSLGEPVLPRDLERQVVHVAEARLLTPVGLRSLARGEPGYHGRCTGPRAQRDAAYHQGTVWGWLIGPFLEAYLRVHDFSPEARRQAGQWLSPLLEHLSQAGLGQVSEVFDGDEPHTPRGCIAQAWSVAEVIRILAMLGAAGGAG